MVVWGGVSPPLSFSVFLPFDCEGRFLYPVQRSSHPTPSHCLLMSEGCCGILFIPSFVLLWSFLLIGPAWACWKNRAKFNHRLKEISRLWNFIAIADSFWQTLHEILVRISFAPWKEGGRRVFVVGERRSACRRGNREQVQGEERAAESLFLFELQDPSGANLRGDGARKKARWNVQFTSLLQHFLSISPTSSTRLWGCMDVLRRKDCSPG